jgi:hypothetical protein
MYGSIRYLHVSPPVQLLTNIFTFQVDVLCIEQDSPNRDYTSVNFASCISGADLVLAASTTMTESILPERNKDSTVTFQVRSRTTLVHLLFLVVQGIL